MSLGRFNLIEWIVILSVIVFFIVTIYVFLKEKDIGDAISAGWVSALFTSWGILGLIFVGCIVYELYELIAYLFELIFG